MTYKKQDAAPWSEGNGVKEHIEAAKLPPPYATTGTEKATHFWDRHSGSIQPMAFLGEAWA